MPLDIEKKGFYTQLLFFFAPLAATSMLMMGSHSIISSTLARTEDAAAALAAYSVAMSIIFIFESPIFAIRRIYIALLDDVDSFKTLTVVAVTTVLGVLAVILTVAYTPIGEYIFINIVGISDSLYPEAIKSFKIFMILPIASALRSVYQSLLVINKQTHFVTMNMIIRLASMLVISYVLLNTDWVSGASIGAFVLGGGMTAEALMSYITGRKLRFNLPEKPENGEKLTYKDTWIFYLPLIGALFVQSFVRPFINAGLARTIDAETALASYQVAYSLSWILVGVSFSIHQLVMVFVEDKETFRKVKRFVYAIGISATAILLVMSLTPIGEWVLVNIIGTTPDITEPAKLTMLPLALIPLLITVTEMYVGLLMLEKKTPVVTISKVANLAMVAIVSIGVASVYPELGGLLAGISMLLGFLGEFLVIYFYGRKIVPNGSRLRRKAV
jgi:Na+-driven multidrug efflux pump